MNRKRLFAFTCVMFIFLFLGANNVFATIKPAVAGDADLDFEINIKDATLIQKFIAEIEVPSIMQKKTSEVDGDSSITIKDATMIQKKCAGLIDSFVVASEIFRDLNVEAIFADYDSGKAMVGIPVTFTAVPKGFGEPYYYQYFVNDEEMSGTTSSNTYIHVFKEVGVYNITVRITSSYGISDQVTILDYIVAEYNESENLMIKSFYHDKSPGPLYEGIGKTTFYAEAMYGSGMYEYAFYLDGNSVQDYGTDNTFVVKDFSKATTHTLTVSVRDMNTGEIANQEMIIVVEKMIIG